MRERNRGKNGREKSELENERDGDGELKRDMRERDGRREARKINGTERKMRETK